MICPIKSGNHEDLLLAYSAGRLDPGGAIAFERHMQSCPDCTLLTQRQTALWNALDAWQPPAVSPGFDARLFARIEAAGSPRWYERFTAFLHPVLLKPALPLTVAGMLVMAGIVLDHRSPTEPFSRHVAAGAGASSIDVEQVESTLEEMEMLRQFD